MSVPLVMIYLRLATRPSSRRRLASGHAAAPPRRSDFSSVAAGAHQGDHLVVAKERALGRGAHDLEFAHGVARLTPSGDGIKDDFYGGRSHLSKVHIASRLSFNSIGLGLEKIFCLLRLPDQL